MFENLIAVSYAGGTGGNAVAYAIGMSPEVLNGWHREYGGTALSDRGSVEVPSRLYNDRLGMPWDIVGVHRMLDMDVYDTRMPLHDSVMRAYLDNLADLVVCVPGRPRLVDALRSRKVVIADHSLPSHQSLLYPGARVVTIRVEPGRALRNFSHKFLLTDDPASAGNLMIDGEIPRGLRSHRRRGRKMRLHEHLATISPFTCEVARAGQAIVVDFDAVFRTDGNTDGYRGMVSSLDLTPVEPTFGPWARRYIDLQWHRDAAAV